MHDDSTCGRVSESATGGCDGHAAGPIVLRDVLDRFEREATLGVCDTGRYRMPYYVWGQGPPLVFVHGVADTSRSFRLVISRLSAHFRCIAYTLPQGTGDGARLWRYRHADLVSDLWALFAHLGLERAYLLGSSFGSTIALEAMRQRPERIPRAILQSGTARRRLRFLERFVTFWLRFFPGPMAKLRRRERILGLVHRPCFEGLPDEVYRAFVDWTGEAGLAAFGHQARLLNGVDLRANLPEIRQPVLLLHGDRDSVMPRRYADELLGGLGSAGLVVLEGAGHVPCYTHPEAMAEVVRQFLTPPGAKATTPDCAATCSMRQAGCPGQESPACGGLDPLPVSPSSPSA